MHLPINSLPGVAFDPTRCKRIVIGGPNPTAAGTGETSANNLSSALVVAARCLAIHSASLTAQVNFPESQFKDSQFTDGQFGDECDQGRVAEYISDSTATIGWSTGQPANMTVRYGTDRMKLTQTASPSESGEARNHHVHLERLTPGTRYYFQLYEGSERVGGVGTFSTVEKGETPERSKVTIPE